MAIIGKYVLARRKELDITQEELARMMGYKTKSSINKIENGTQDVPLPKVEELARCLNTTPAYLMGWTEEQEEAFNAGTVLGIAARDPNQIKLLSNYQKLDNDRQGQLLQFSEALTLLS